MTVAATFKAATVPRIAAKPKTGMRDHMTVAAAFKAATVPRIARRDPVFIRCCFYDNPLFNAPLPPHPFMPARV